MASLLSTFWSPVPWAHAGFSYRIFPPMCSRSLQSRMTPCHLMRTACALVATSPRVGWWASWSRLRSSSARSVPQRLLQPSSHPPGARRTELGLAASSRLDQGRLWCPQIASALQGRGCHNGHTLIPTACSLARDNSTVLSPFTRVATKPQRGETMPSVTQSARRHVLTPHSPTHRKR